MRVKNGGTMTNDTPIDLPVPDDVILRPSGLRVVALDRAGGIVRTIAITGDGISITHWAQSVAPVLHIRYNGTLDVNGFAL